MKTSVSGEWPFVRKIRTPLQWLLGILFVAAGVFHFIVPELYAQIVPDYLPAHLLLVYLSGLAEIGLGVAVLIERTRRLAAWGLVALLVAVFPANIYMAMHQVQIQGLPEWMSQPSPAALWLRLPFQGVFLLWAWWYTRDFSEGAVKS